MISPTLTGDGVPIGKADEPNTVSMPARETNGAIHHYKFFHAGPGPVRVARAGTLT
jgi:hypothetical protein